MLLREDPCRSMRPLSWLERTQEVIPSAHGSHGPGSFFIFCSDFLLGIYASPRHKRYIGKIFKAPPPSFLEYPPAALMAINEIGCYLAIV